MKKGWTRILAFSILLLTGCVPTFPSEPYRQAELVSIRPGETTRDEVLSLFGRPVIERKEKSLWLYGQSDLAAVVVGYVITPFYDYQWLIVEFEDEFVSRYELVEDKYGCSTSGVCLVSGWPATKKNKGKMVLEPRMTVLTNNGADDEVAKRFDSFPNGCGIYIYYDTTKHPVRANPSVSIGSIEKLSVSESSFLWTTVEQGTHPLVVHPYSEKGEDIHETIECKEENLKFYEIQTPWPGFPFTGHPDTKLRCVEQSKGMKAVRERQVVITP